MRLPATHPEGSPTAASSAAHVVQYTLNQSHAPMNGSKPRMSEYIQPGSDP